MYIQSVKLGLLPIIYFSFELIADSHKHTLTTAQTQTEEEREREKVTDKPTGKTL